MSITPNPGHGSVILPEGFHQCFSPPEVLAENKGSRGEQHLGSLAILLRWQPGLQWVPWLNMAVLAQAGALLIALVAGGSLTTREEEMKGNGGTSYLLLMLSGCISFQHCKTGTGLEAIDEREDRALGET